MNLIVVYDIADSKRLRRVAKTVEDYGVRVQKSVFEVTVDRARFKEMHRRIKLEIEEDEDAVKYFPMCVRCAGSVEIIGQGVFVDPDNEFTVL